MSDTNFKTSKNVLTNGDYIRSRGRDVTYYVFKRINVNKITITICAFELKKRVHFYLRQHGVVIIVVCNHETILFALKQQRRLSVHLNTHRCHRQKPFYSYCRARDFVLRRSTWRNEDIETLETKERTFPP